MDYAFLLVFPFFCLHKKTVAMLSKVSIVIIAGLVARVFFYLFGGVVYYGTPDFTLNGDSYAWIDSILNLINHGHYTADPEVPNASFYRPPGLAFLIGFFYLVTGSDLNAALAVIPWVQIGMDTICIYFIYKITFSLVSNSFTALTAAVLYAFYPFIIVWTPVITAESSSIFYMLAALYFFYGRQRFNYLFAGILLGIAVLTRLQVIFLFPFLAASMILRRDNIYKFKTGFVQFVIAFSVVYGSWPVRNLLLHDRLLFAQDLNVGRNWSPDYLAFMEYIFSIQTDHKPQYDQIVNFEKVVWPQHAYLHEGDSALLAQTVELCRTCGTGFSYFMHHLGTRNAIVSPEENCDSVIAAAFSRLTADQKSDNAFSYYVKIPLNNLYKSFFKLHLYGDKPMAVKVISLALFLYRSLLIFAGIAGLILMFKKRLRKDFIFALTGFFVSWYLYLCFIYRNIEIRYLLPVDLLLLIPAAYIFSHLLIRKQEKRTAA